MPTVAVIGASTDRAKYGNKAVRAYLAQGWTVYPVHPKEPAIEGVKAYPSIRDVKGPLDRVTLYVPAAVGEKLLGDIAAVGTKELLVNPGTESDALMRRAGELGLNPVFGCAIAAVGMSPAALP
jgi:predicted CoA-binding protein